MNERIEELKQQAADYVDSIDNGIGIEEYRKLLDQKFAELIVKECLSIVEAQKDCLSENVEDWSEIDSGYSMAVNDSVDMVKQHFGVEE